MLQERENECLMQEFPLLHASSYRGETVNEREGRGEKGQEKGSKKESVYKCNRGTGYMARKSWLVSGSLLEYKPLSYFCFL